MIGTAGLRGHRIDCIVGIYEHERQQPQPIVMDIEFDYDFEKATESDQIGGAVDYDRVVEGVNALVRGRNFSLIETMAEETAAMLLAEHPSLQTVRLEVRKPDAVPSAECSFVRLERTR